MKRDIDELFMALARSQFRRRFKLRGRELRYLHEKGLPTILAHARELLSERLAPAHPLNDGRQTPMANHPVFIAQHATATCCRGCLAKWRGIPAGRALTSEEMGHILGVIELWLRPYSVLARSARAASDNPAASTARLFPDADRPA